MWCSIIQFFQHTSKLKKGWDGACWDEYFGNFINTILCTGYQSDKGRSEWWILLPVSMVTKVILSEKGQCLLLSFAKWSHNKLYDWVSPSTHIPGKENSGVIPKVQWRVGTTQLAPPTSHAFSCHFRNVSGFFLSKMQSGTGECCLVIPQAMIKLSAFLSQSQCRTTCLLVHAQS